MTDDRIRELMKQTPCPDRVSVYLAMKQLASEVEQEVMGRMGLHWWDKMPRPQDYPQYPTLPYVTFTCKYGEGTDGNPLLNKGNAT